MTRLLFDIEADNLLEEATKIHCVVTMDLDTLEVKSYVASQLQEACRALEAADELWGHNIITYDIPMLQKFCGLKVQTCVSKHKIRDTLVCSRHMWLNLKDLDFEFRKKHPKFPGNLIGSHSLEAWGHRLEVYKADFGKTTDWKEFTPEMLAYCIQDVKVNHGLVEKILSKNYPEAALDNEHRFQQLIFMQQQFGFRFDREAAVKLYATLSQRRQDLEKELKLACPGWYEEMKVPDYYFVRPEFPFEDGVTERHFPTKAAAEQWRKANGIRSKDFMVEAGPLRKKHTPFNPGSHDHIARFLIEKYAWSPQEYGDNGKPTTSEEVLEALPYPEIKLLVEYLMVEKRIGQLAEGDKAWLKLEKKGRIHGSVNTNGAVSTRVTHSFPNLSQVPAIDKPFGKECRALFCADEGWSQVGADASGIQLRSLAHYMADWDGGAYAEILLKGDIHTAHQQAAGFATRDMAKTFIYAFLLGAQAEKVGSIAGTNKASGQRLINSFLSKFPALKALKDAVTQRVKTRGYLVGLDGRILPCRSAHAALSSLLQGFEACVMKRAYWITFEKLTALGLVHGKDYGFQGFFHDELQITCRTELAETIGKTVVAAIEQAGVEFKSRCPLTGAYRVGKNWADCH